VGLRVETDRLGEVRVPADKLEARGPNVLSNTSASARIRNLVSCFGIEDRRDGGGVIGLVSNPEAAEAQNAKVPLLLSGE
jgi:hypothetical protein